MFRSCLHCRANRALSSLVLGTSRDCRPELVDEQGESTGLSSSGASTYPSKAEPAQARDLLAAVGPPRRSPQRKTEIFSQ